ncbi:uncharacterized protein LOC132745368 isoform X2 [Ruditapes philippinarum]|nr:uncharacterized protein LOC132745368 isoform X2 [Ruditapes philippinarum]
MCQHFGRNSEEIFVTCKAICEQIKSKHVAIAYVWAAYTIQNKDRISFVIIQKRQSEGDNSKEPLHLEFAYSFVIQYVGDFSTEGSEVIRKQTSVSEGLDEMSYQTLYSCISNHSEDLMKRHKFLSIISACSNRSKGFGVSWNLLPEKCIVFYVQKKNYIPIDEEPFEKYYDGIAVDVREGVFIPYGRTARVKLDPVKMGCQIRGDIYNSQYVEGTLGCFVDHPQFGVCGLTCAHVLLSPDELQQLKTTYSGSLKWPLHDMHKNVFQPADLNSSSIGHTVQFIYEEGSSSKSGMEVALFKITDRQPKSADFPVPTIISASSVKNIQYDGWRLCSTNRLNNKKNIVTKFGSKTEFRHGTLTFDNTAVKSLESYPLSFGYAVIKLFKQIEVKAYDLAFAGHGDSGALVFLADNNSQHTCIGIVEGGTSYGTAVVTPIVPILEELKVHCLKSFDSETNLTNIENQIQSMHGDIQTIKCNLQKIDNSLQMIAQSLSNNQQ